MNIESLRSSAIGSCKDCQWKYYLEYYAGISSIANFKASKGTLAHLVLELLAKSKKTEHYKLKDKYSDYKYLLDICWQRFLKDNSDHYEITDKDYKFCQKSIEAVLNTCYNPLNLKVIKTELQFELDINKKGFKTLSGKNCLLRGTIDLVTENDSNTIEVIDYKTGKRTDWITGKVKELEDFQKDIQLRIYDLALYTLFPQYKYRMFTIFYTNDGGPFTVSFSDKERQETIDILRKEFNTIKAIDDPKRLIDDQTRRSEFFKCKKVCSYGKYGPEGSTLNFCDLYYSYYKANGLEKTPRVLQSLTIDKKPIPENSKRNDYNRSNIYKSKL